MMGIMGIQAGKQRTVLVAHPGSELYGSDRVLLENVRGLLEQDWCVYVALPQTGPLADALRGSGATVVYIPFPVLRKSILTLKGAAQYLADGVRGIRAGSKLIREVKPKSIFVNTATIPFWILLAKFTRLPAIVHIHESERNAHPLVRFALAAPATLCDSIISNSDYSTDSLAQYAPWLRKRTTVIYNGVPGPESTSSPRENLDGHVKLLFVGRLSERKGPHVAIEATRLLQEMGIDVKLDILGAVYPGYEWLEERLRTQILGLPRPENVRMLGFDPSVWSHYQNTDIALVPSTVDEPFGNTAVEAVLAERPVVVSRIGGLPEAVEGFPSAVLVEPDNAVAIADAIRDFIQDWPATRISAARARHDASERYDPHSFGQKIASEVNQLGND